MKSGWRYLMFFMVAALLSSCVGNRKLAYLQDKEARGDERYFADAKVQAPKTNYKLRTGDVLFIRMEKFRVGEEIFNISGFDQGGMRAQIQHPYILGYRIDDEGSIDLPLIGKVEVAGLAIDEVEIALTAMAEKQYPGSEVQVFQLDGTISILGEVRNVGRYGIFKERNTILDVIASAGGLGDYADRSQIKIIREIADEQIVFHIDLNDINALSDPAFHLVNNDIVVVTPLRRRKYVTTNIQWLVSSVTALVAISSLVLSITR
jgi:polysaccharide export outer membrane protein